VATERSCRHNWTPDGGFSPLAWKWWQAALTLVSVAFGSMLFLNARKLWAKIVAVAAATFLILGPAMLWLAGPFVLNFMIQGRIGAPLYNYSRGTLYGLAASVFGSAFAVMCLIARRFRPAPPASG
jgi:hypothetical protein